MLGSALITGSGVFIGKGIVKVVPESYLKYLSAGLFLFFGAIFLISAVLGIEIL
jgi:putative Ca2+/H+ antiporter (TMEM165/GDT1 family)